MTDHKQKNPPSIFFTHLFNGICKRFYKTIRQEFYQPILRRKMYGSLDELQKDLDGWLIFEEGERAQCHYIKPYRHNYKLEKNNNKKTVILAHKAGK
ncbi:hypothetical protein AB835_00560 [Candidatus Endobugula sertula]|uniref:Uncharacterized protein n=1 Tax=Candidatus Endobugula sertula TaxID=62101 RepID=A0A1D2QTW7_9GAMM|nr:hypothetical protein AB835_00560 [Candidatus Endobugula sertula]